MNWLDARHEAAKRWGQRAIVTDPGRAPCKVGVLLPDDSTLFHGEGETYELAFEAADNRGARERILKGEEPVETMTADERIYAARDRGKRAKDEDPEAA